MKTKLLARLLALPGFTTAAAGCSSEINTAREYGECAGCRMFRYCGGNGMHLRDAKGRLMVCHYNKLAES